jgi:hypothetical protein
MQEETDSLNSTRKETSGSNTSNSEERTLSMREVSYSTLQEVKTRTDKAFSSGRDTTD